MYSTLGDFIRPKGIRSSDLNDADGNPLSDTDDKLRRWSEYFVKLLNTDLKIDEEVLKSVRPTEAPDDEPPRRSKR